MEKEQLEAEEGGGCLVEEWLEAEEGGGWLVEEWLEAEEVGGWLVEEKEKLDAEEGCSVGNAGGWAAKDNDYNNN